MIYLVWCEEKQVGFSTTDYQLAYEVRKGAINNIGFVEDSVLWHLAHDYCHYISCEFDCEIIEVENAKV
ncbi:TPA: hypothetical protein ACOA2N_003428 [Vibrio cholerae]